MVTDPWAGVTCLDGAVPAVTKLELYDNGSGKFSNVAGDVGALSPLVQRTDRCCSATRRWLGDVKGLAPLVQLTNVELFNTKVTWQATALAPLVHLSVIQLESTVVAGFHTQCDPKHGADGCSNDGDHGCYCVPLSD